MEKNSSFSRRSFVAGSTATITAVAASLNHRFSLADDAAKKAGVEGKIRHSACKWCYKKIDVDTLCREGRKFGLQSVELLNPDQFATLRKTRFGLRDGELSVGQDAARREGRGHSKGL